MSNEYVQSNYEALDTIAQRFGKQAELTAQMLQRLKQQSEKLRSTWEGRAADAFTREMTTVLLPGVKRLHQAHVQARATVLAIKQTMETAESEAAGLFRGTSDGGSSGGGFSGAMVDGVANTGGGFSSTVADGAGGSGGFGGAIPASMGGGGAGGGFSNAVFDGATDGGMGGTFVRAASFTTPEGGMGGGGLENGSGDGGGGDTSTDATSTTTTQNEPTITFGARANQDVVSEHSRGVLSDILEESGNSSATITSTARTVEDQARIMYGNIERDGVAEQKRLYGSNGDKVIDAYVAAKAEGLDEMGIRTRMVEKINELGPTNVSKHLADPNVLNVIDVSPNSIADREAFEAAVRADPRVSKFLTPSDGDPAYHIEIPQPQPAETTP
jgi:WXG100 family type VII secretion target